MSYLKDSIWTADFKLEIASLKYSKSRFYMHLFALFGITSDISQNVSTKRLDIRMMKVGIYVCEFERKIRCICARKYRKTQTRTDMKVSKAKGEYQYKSLMLSKRNIRTHFSVVAVHPCCRRPLQYLSMIVHQGL